MAVKLFVLLACVALGNAALVKREAPSLLEEFQKNIQELSKPLAEGWEKITSSPNTEELKKAITDGKDSVLTQLSSFSATLQAAATEASGKAKEALEAARANIEKTAADLRAAHPEVEQQAAALRDQVQQAVQSAAVTTQNLAKEVQANAEDVNAKLAPKVQEAFNNFTKEVQNVGKKLHETANKQ